MTSPDAHAGRLGLGGFRPGAGLVPRLLSVVHAPALDADLAEGVRPSTSPAHRLRAEHLRRPRVRRRISHALARAVVEADRERPRATAQVPLDSEAILGCKGDLRALAKAVADLDDPRTQGLAIAFLLAFDGAGALFRQPSRNAQDRLGSSVRAALASLRVSAQFDQLEI